MNKVFLGTFKSGNVFHVLSTDEKKAYEFLEKVAKAKGETLSSVELKKGK